MKRDGFDRRDTLRPIGDPRRQQFLLDPELEARIDGEVQVGPRLALLRDRRRIEQRLAARVTLRDDDPRLAGEGRLVRLLDAVLAAAVAIDEAQEIGRETRGRPATGLRIHPLRFRFE